MQFSEKRQRLGPLDYLYSIIYLYYYNTVSSVCVTPRLTRDPGGVVSVGGEAAGAEVLAAEAGLERGLGARGGQQPHRQHHQACPRGQ